MNLFMIMMTKKIKKRGSSPSRIRRTALLLALISMSLGGCSVIELHIPEETAKTASAAETESSAFVTEPVTTPITETDDEGGIIVPDNSTPEQKEEKAKAALDALREGDFDGMNFLIAAVDTSAAFGVNTGDSALRYDRLQMIRETRRGWVEDKYNVHILTFTYTQNELYREVSQAYLSDTRYVADFYAIPPEDLGKYQRGRLLLNLRNLPFTDYNAAYYNKRAMGAMSAGSGIYAAAGSYTEAPENLCAIFFNSDMTEKLGLESPYKLVNDGTWDWETFFAYSKAARNDGTGVYGDNLGLLTLTDAERLVLSSSGLHMATGGLDHTPTVTPQTDKVQAVADILYNYIYKGNTSPTDPAAYDTDALFAGGKLLFAYDDLSSVFRRADIKPNWGVVPLPKAYDGQRSYDCGCGDCAVLAVPSVTGAPEKTGMLLQALFAANNGAFADTLLNDALLYYVRDGKCVEMLDLILGHTSYDFASMFASGYSALSSATVGGLHQTVVTTNSFERLYQNAKNAAETELKRAFPVIN